MNTQDAIQLAEVAAPIAGAAVAANNPEIATALRVVPLALQVINSAHQLAQAGGMSPADLASLFATIGQNVQAAQSQWEAMNNVKTA